MDRSLMCKVLGIVSASSALLATGVSMATNPVVPLPANEYCDPGEMLRVRIARNIYSSAILLKVRSIDIHAADVAEQESALFRSPSVFSEYSYTDSRDKRPAGFTSHMRSGTLGLNFMTVGDVAVSLSTTYGSTAADSRVPGHLINNADNAGLCLSAAKNIDWFLYGVSAGYNDSVSRTRTPAGRILRSDTDGFTLAPFIGAIYTSGNLSFSTIPTYLFSRNWLDYDSTGANASDDHMAQETFVWMNTVDYSLSEKVGLGFIMNWNRVTHVRKQLNAASQTGDREWLTAGPRVTYHFTPALSAFVSATQELCSGTYSTWQGVVGAEYAF